SSSQSAEISLEVQTAAAQLLDTCCRLRDQIDASERQLAPLHSCARRLRRPPQLGDFDEVEGGGRVWLNIGGGGSGGFVRLSKASAATLCERRLSELELSASRARRQLAERLESLTSTAESRQALDILLKSSNVSLSELRKYTDE
ncbi:hypothetical protein BOX15_Mlig014546g4, partial [Macrostomum lignano]